MPSDIQVHALAYVPRESPGIPAETDRAADDPALYLPDLPGPVGVQSAGHAPADGRDAPVPQDPARRPDGYPKAAAYHRLTPPFPRTVPRACSPFPISPAFLTTSPWSVRLPPRLSPTPC